MAVKHTTAATAITRAPGVGTAGPCTIFARCRPDVQTTWGNWINQGDTVTGNQNGLFWNNTTQAVLVVAGTSSADIFTATLGVWYDVALTSPGGTGAGTLIGYGGATGGTAAMASQTATPAAIANAPVIWIGEGTGGEFMNGAHADIMVWTAQLTASELEQQRRSRRPIVRLPSLWAWVPAPTPADVFDYSGKARHFTTTTTTTVEDVKVPQLQLSRR